MITASQAAKRAQRILEGKQAESSLEDFYAYIDKCILGAANQGRKCIVIGVGAFNPEMVQKVRQTLILDCCFNTHFDPVLHTLIIDWSRLMQPKQKGVKK